MTVRLKAAPPAVAAFGLRPVVAGSGLLILKLCALEVPPPGSGLKTVTEAVPAVAMSAAEMAAVNCDAETKVVVLAEPFQCTTDPDTKLPPLTVRVKATPPAVAEPGFRLVVVGRGLVMLKLSALEVPPPGSGLKIVTEAVPGVAMSAAETAAVN